MINESSKLKILVAMPAYNEEKYIGTLVLKAKQYAYEVIVVDDGSTDQTSKVGELSGAVVIRHEVNQGKGSAIQIILQEAKRRDPDILVLLDADCQHNPDEIPCLIEPILSGDADMTIGSRETERYKTPYYRRIGQKVLLHSTNILSRVNLTDSESGFRALSREAVAKLQLKQKGFAIETEMIADAADNGLRITEVPISNTYTKDGSTLNPLRHGISVIAQIIAMISERRPLLFFGLSGSVLLIIGAAIGVIVVRDVNVGHDIPIGSALLSVLFSVIGMLSIFTGVILNALASKRS